MNSSAHFSLSNTGTVGPQVSPDWGKSGVTTHWSYNCTEVTVDSEGLARSEGGVGVTTTTSRSSSGSNSSNGISASDCTTAVTSAGGSQKEVKVPKNAVELIAWAILDCSTTTPSLCDIATHIQTHISTYHQHDLGQLLTMVQHHLTDNQPAIFLPVMPVAGRNSSDPALARWAVNRQAVEMAEDGSLVRRRRRHHPYKPTTLSTPPPFGPGPSAREGGSHLGTPFSAACPGNANTPYHYPAFGQNGPTMMSDTTMSMFGTRMGAGLYGVPVGAGDVGKMPPSRLPAYPWSFC